MVHMTQQVLYPLISVYFKVVVLNFMLLLNYRTVLSTYAFSNTTTNNLNSWLAVWFLFSFTISTPRCFVPSVFTYFCSWYWHFNIVILDNNVAPCKVQYILIFQQSIYYLKQQALRSIDSTLFVVDRGLLDCDTLGNIWTQKKRGRRMKLHKERNFTVYILTKALLVQRRLYRTVTGETVCKTTT
jgi:hypothetical protein